jgi:hypothetical protein
MPQLGVTIAVLSLITPRPLDPGTMLAQAMGCSPGRGFVMPHRRFLPGWLDCVF